MVVFIFSTLLSFFLAPVSRTVLVLLCCIRSTISQSISYHEIERSSLPPSLPPLFSLSVLFVVICLFMPCHAWWFEAQILLVVDYVTNHRHHHLLCPASVRMFPFSCLFVCLIGGRTVPFTFTCPPPATTTMVCFYL